MIRKILPSLLAGLLVVVVLLPLKTSTSQGYPKLANIFYAWQLTDADVVELATWDVVLLDMDQQVRNPEKIQRLRSLNPDIKIIAYIASQEIKQANFTSESFLLSRQLADSIPEEWFLRAPGGGRISWWSGSWMLNVTDSAPLVNGQRWNTFLPQFISQRLMSSGLWDGVILDNTWDNISYFVADYDLNGDGQKEESAAADAAWQAGMRTIISNTRSMIGGNKLIIGNGTVVYGPLLDGVIFENFPNVSWDQEAYQYRTTPNGSQGNYHILNSTTANSGNRADYRAMRYGLATALLGDGYYSFDDGDQNHGQTWRYDEYDISLGNSTNSARQVASLGLGSGVWRRDFESGVVFVNSTGERQAVNLGSEVLEKLSGTQDPTINDGTRLNYLRLDGKDGVILKRTTPAPKDIIGATFFNGSFVRVFDSAGRQAQDGFYAFRQEFTGRQQIIINDVDRDGEREVIVANDRAVTIYNSTGVAENTFYPYGERYRKGINISIGDLNGDGTKEIITGTENGGGPHIRVFNDGGRLINPGFFAYGKDYRGGVNIAVGDLNGDGTNEIIAGAGVGGGPHIRIFNKDGKLLSAGWFAESPTFRGGVNVAVGDLNGDGRDEIVSAPGRGGRPEIRIWDSQGQRVGGGWLAFDASNKSGVEVMVNDINGDGLVDILASSVDVF